MHLEDAILYAEIAMTCHEKFNMPLRIITMDIRKAFNTVDHVALIQALRSRELPQEHASLLSISYTNQEVSINRSSEFKIQRHVKQDDTLSVILCNCVLDVIFDTWRLSLQNKIK